MSVALRFRIVEIGLGLVFLMIIFRLFYWQVMSGSRLDALAQSQFQSLQIVPADRGEILANDGFPLVANQPAYVVYAYKPDLVNSPQEIGTALSPLLLGYLIPPPASPGAQPVIPTTGEISKDIATKLTDPSLTWIPLARHISADTMTAITDLKFKGIGFDTLSARLYPEASMAAQLLGFVGSDGTGKPKGYFGLEGYYDLELSGKPGLIREQKDVQGRPILIGDYQSVDSRPGRSLKTHLDRGLQILIEQSLQTGLVKYQSPSGEVTVMDPQTGAILAMAAIPAYDPAVYRDYPPDTYRIPAIGDTYEPGSTFKTVVMAAALDAQAVTPDTICADPCLGPVTIGKYTLRTWDNHYYPGETMTQILERSDNVGMIHVAQLLGKDNLVNAIKRFGFGQVTGVDLEGEVTAPLRSSWGDIDLATAAFGQGIAVTSVQMLSAVSALGNGGLLMQPQVVAEVIDPQGTITIAPKVVRQVISPETAKLITGMMVQSALHGEAHWRLPPGYQIAGKTGTAQIPVQGHYDAQKTIASFIGFAPADHPRFAMLVKLTSPQSSQWASETAAPLWFDLCTQILHYLNVPPGN